MEEESHFLLGYEDKSTVEPVPKGDMKEPFSEPAQEVEGSTLKSLREKYTAAYSSLFAASDGKPVLVEVESNNPKGVSKCAMVYRFFRTVPVIAPALLVTAIVGFVRVSHYFTQIISTVDSDLGVDPDKTDIYAEYVLLWEICTLVVDALLLAATVISSGEIRMFVRSRALRSRNGRCLLAVESGIFALLFFCAYLLMWLVITPVSTTTVHIDLVNISDLRILTQSGHGAVGCGDHRESSNYAHRPSGSFQNTLDRVQIG